MSKAKTNALDALRALIAERQQYEQWLATLESKREGTPEHVLDRVRSDYIGRLDRVVGEIRSHAEELQLSISALSSRLVEVARDEDTRREGLQEAELRAAVGEYEPEQWQQLKAEAESALEKIAVDRQSLDNQLSELRSIQKLSEAGAPAAGASTSTSSDAGSLTPTENVSRDSAAIPIAPAAANREAVSTSADSSRPAQSLGHRSGTAAVSRSMPDEPPAAAPQAVSSAVSSTDTAVRAEPEAAARSAATPSQERVPLEPVAEAASSAASAAGRPRAMKSPPGGMAAVRSKSEGGRPDGAKTLKCPECGTPNLPTEWYCERCGGELATM